MADRFQVLVDAADDRRLHRDGFVRRRLISAADAADLRAAHQALEPPEGPGFVPDLGIADPAYRQAANALLRERLEDVVTACFTDHRPFLRNFLCKYPGPDSDLYLHRDWMFVDERCGGATYVVWTALEDITGHNGQLQVLRGSHRLDEDVRGTELGPPWLRHQEAIRARLLTVPVAAGECVIFHNALIHCSLANHTDSPRVVAAMGMRPNHQALVHFRRTGPAEAVRYDVDESFFLDYTPAELIAGPPRLDPVESLPVTQTDLSEVELAAAIDGGLHGRLDRLRRRRSRQAVGMQG